MASQEKISVYNLADLKNTTDDAIPNYLLSLKFRPTHTLENTSLALSFSAILIALCTLAWDYNLGFSSTKHYTACAVALYTILNTALTLHTLFIRRGTIYEGTAPSGESIRISTKVTKNVPVYEVTVEIVRKGGKKEVVEIKREFMEWFDVTGRFVAGGLQRVLATGVDVVGRADPKRVVKEDGEGEGLKYSLEALDALAKGVEAEGTGAELKGKKGERKRKA